ncbi:hypothetical protein D3C77_698410 [compost metagenome]
MIGLIGVLGVLATATVWALGIHILLGGKLGPMYSRLFGVVAIKRSRMESNSKNSGTKV